VRLVAIPGIVAALSFSWGCQTSRYSSPGTLGKWEEAAVPICSADTEGAMIQGSLTGFVEPRFAGRVVRVGREGARIPVPNVQFFRYIYNFWVPGAVADWEPTKSYLAPESFTTNEDGTFRDNSSNTTPGVTLMECHDGKPVARRVPQAVVFLLRASSCQDLRVTFDASWVPHDIEMSCHEQLESNPYEAPGRQGVNGP
jgi:hypothetical protein